MTDDVADEQVERARDAAYDKANEMGVDLEISADEMRAALSAVLPAAREQAKREAHREAFDVAHAFARTGVDGILARLVDLLDGEIRPIDAVAQARREALEEAAAYVDRVADEFERFASTCEPSDEKTRAELNDLVESHRSAATVIRSLIDKPTPPKET